jgi:transposase InsO family protein
MLRRLFEFTQYVSIRYSERLAEAGIEPSVGSTGDSYDNAPAETINGLYKGRDHPPARALEDARGGRAGHARMGLVVQPSPPA